ncbi:chemotaxis protein CheA [Aquisalibacillus elongatus]|uniref:Chemotaxis protein CheA n=1 Tax=Aquisalibacillus elongatus TaxID=485577 RepID=A0A3N5CB70_9BACI|nr:chemotaxis protein CheA [Aquisalibacillus elongatus]RPF55975.1 two-component system chemotaxis sensor kinase CheA [Aquisalibacillus elongatus]
METNQYLEVFIDESQENLQVMNDRLLALENNPNDLTIVNDIFRAAHTLKGMSATMGFEDLADLTHKLENVFDAIRNEHVPVTSDVNDVLFDSIEALEEIVADVSNGGEGKKDVSAIVEKLKAIESGETFAETDNHTPKNTNLKLDQFEQTVIEQAQTQGQNVYHITVTLSEDCLLKAARVYMVFEVLEKAGEVIKSLPPVEQLEEEDFEESFQLLLVTEDSHDDLTSKIFKVSEVQDVHIEQFNIQAHQQESAAKEEVTASTEVKEKPQPSKETEASNDSSDQPSKKQVGNKTIRVNIDRLDALMNLFEELIIDRGRLEQLAQTLEHQDFRETVERMSRTSSDLQNVILNMRMVPIEQVFNRFPRMVRSLARDLGKDIDFQIEGAETELDRTVIDEIGDPLVHLIRNAVDHGIEMPEERKQLQKPQTGQLLLKAYHSGNHVFVEIKDDGGGINQEKVLQKALERQVITQEQAQNLTNKQTNELIMSSGFSTADQISDISGRGVGLDVVKNTIESLGGTIEIQSEYQKGTTFLIKLPLTLSIISVMLVVLQDETYAIPLSSIIETTVIKDQDIYKAHGEKVIDFRGNIIPLIDLKDVLDVPQSDQTNEDQYSSVVIVRKGDQMAGLVVDSFIGQQEIVLKNLGNYLKQVFALSGATILGDGDVALIIDTNALIK